MTASVLTLVFILALATFAIRLAWSAYGPS
jgi:hypothetical protein